MQSRLPEKCDLFQLAEKGATIEGTWPVSKMTRLLDMLGSDSGEAYAEMNFEKSGRTRFVKGRVSVEVEIECQRCMSLMSFPIDAEFSLALIETEAQIEALPEEFEPLVTEGRHFLPDVIEDELILAIPIVPVHDTECSDFMNAQKEEQKVNEPIEDKKPNPFAVLKDIL